MKPNMKNPERPDGSVGIVNRFGPGRSWNRGLIGRSKLNFSSPKHPVHLWCRLSSLGWISEGAFLRGKTSLGVNFTTYLHLGLMLRVSAAALQSIIRRHDTHRENFIFCFTFMKNVHQATHC